MGASEEEGALEARRLPLKRSRVPRVDGVSGMLPPEDSQRPSVLGHPALPWSPCEMIMGCMLAI